MRRALSILLVAIFGFASFAPLVQSSHASRLPVCCRRRGVHHCSSMGEMPEDAAARIVAASSGANSGTNSGPAATVGAPSRCPLYPGALHATLTPVFAPAPQHFVPAASQTVERIHAFSATYADSSSSSAHAVRGPPTVVLA
ncbi:hypothetical protein [Terracidiphilus gabretensis]|jgi:hypothetical protein|uniref:hypothetical protein n=1 Tax=Terracidiphilus gabretensis TaxID=1577687 RepID=UPI00071B54E3|nr:hypothetical protein [Terracidiphilus gabretensis]